MPGKTQAYSDDVLNVMRGVAVAGVTPFVGLFSTAPTDDGDPGVELVGDNYSRQAVTLGVPVADVGNVRKSSNTTVPLFGPATGNWLAAVAFGVFDAAGGGTLRYWDMLTGGPVTVLLGQSAAFPVGFLILKED